ncbi:NADH-ubiquinone oxidoreductase-F iron-sulfur binding region domain-containing protein [Nakamurella sp. PAMC28650]|uniref:NADH-ubiquinone oxidoreductase-F iron-sulfur binding region domain-containing protein n=1 Tax=Nakamurella sp. PAMC28650 TaxID=2762325 RepID=UPI00164E7609|nr:NADH-ubiquinone oxidoreductase-F iron-sulfur binding region domain-containing protein [Nakamurella sp. PAMC28650]QNK81464.1 proton-conducting membrane transporter [Nakamurella sp. PAMC28650]
MTTTLDPATMSTRIGVARLLPAQPALSWADHLRRLGHVPLQVASELAEMASAAGLVGRGGAAFPTGRKMTAVAGNASRRRPAVVVANCCEGDPTASKDAVLLANSPHLVIDGAVLAAAAVGADKVILAVHRGSATTGALRTALAERPAEGIEFSIVGVPARFVASEATALVRYLNTGDARPAGRTSVIWESGVQGRPTLVDNAETLAQLALIARFGASWFRAVGTAAEPGTLLVTVGGAVGVPGVVEVAGGTPLRTILTAAQWTPTRAGVPAWALIGGLAGCWVDLNRAAETGFSAAELGAIGGTKGVASIVVLPAGGCVLTETARILQYLADAGARQCGPCMFGLPAIAEDMAALAGGDRSAVARLGRRLPVIDKRGGCGHPDGAVALAASALRALRGPEAVHLDGHLRHGPCRSPAPVVPLGHENSLRSGTR